MPSRLDQLTTVLGLVEDVPVEFTPSRNVPVAGVLPGLALLCTTGLMEEARQVYGRLKNGWYGLRATLWTLLIMALLRIRRAEQLKGFDPAPMGQALGTALAAGLVWWEYDHGWSVRSLGPLAIVFALVLLCAARRQGGFWAG